MDTACLHAADDVVMARFVFCTTNATACGAACECRVPGMLRCQFSAQNKLVSCEFMFDIMSFMQQLQCAAGPPELMRRAPGGSSGGGLPHEVPIVANTLQMACAESSEARAITAARPPYPVVYVNARWTELCGYTLDEIRGGSLACLQGPSTDQRQVGALMRDLRRGHPASMTVTNYCKSGRPFQNYLRVFPLSSGGGGGGGVSSSADPTHFLAVLEELPMASMEPVPHLQGTTLGAKAAAAPAFEKAAAAVVVVPGVGGALAGEATAVP